MYILKPFKQVLVPVGLQMRGEVTARAIDVTTGKVVDERTDHNTILAQYLNSIFTSKKALIGTSGGGIRTYDSALYQCAIGTDNIPAVITDTGIKGTKLSTVVGTNVSCTALGAHPIVAKRKFVIPAGTGTGEVGEAVLVECPNYLGYVVDGEDYRLGYNSSAVARKTFDPKINKTDVIQLEIEWTYTVQRAGDSNSGTIINGQRDGTTNIDWVATINNYQLFRWCFGYTHYTGGAGREYVGVQTWSTSRRCNVGSSNSPSDLVNDGDTTIKGSQLFPITTDLTLGSVSSYVGNSFYRDIEYGFDITQANGSIGEIVPTSKTDYDSTNYGLARITFNPPLDKPAPSSSGWRIYLTVRYQIGQG